MIFDNYRKIAIHKVFICSALITGFMYSVVTLFNVVGPFLIQTVLHYTPIDYGHIALLLGGCWFLGNFIVRYFMHRISLKMFILGSMVLMLVVSIVMLILASVMKTNIVITVAPTMVIFFAAAIIFPICMAKCMSLFPKMAGSASALMVSCFVVAAGIMSGV